MTLVEIARQIVEKHQAMLIKPSADGQYEQREFYDSDLPTEQEEVEGRKPSGRAKGWVLLDATTASAIVLVHDALNEKNRASLLALPLPKLVYVVWKLVQ